MNSRHIFHWLFALFFVCASIIQSKASAQTKCSKDQFQASEGMERMKRALIGAGADINATDKAGYTALMYAVAVRKEGEIEELLRSGADVNIKAKDGHTALSLAKKNYIENSLTEQLLRQFGAVE
jgi:ankyrin repeat protein